MGREGGEGREKRKKTLAKFMAESVLVSIIRYFCVSGHSPRVLYTLLHSARVVHCTFSHSLHDGTVSIHPSRQPVSSGRNYCTIGRV